MLQVLNRLCHGFIWAPVAIAVEEAGVIAYLEREGPAPAGDIVAHFGANAGTMQVALDLLCYEGALVRVADRYGPAPSYRPLPDDARGVVEVYRHAPHELVAGEAGGAVLARWLRHADSAWNDGAGRSTLLDGSFLLPMLIGLAQGELSAALAEGDAAAIPAVEAIRESFVRRNWAKLEDSAFVLSGAGKFMIGRALNGGVAASYRPLLSRMSDMLFGDCDDVMARGSDGEGHIDRDLNVVSSGFQHDRFFADMEKVLVALLQNGSGEGHALSYIADMGCGDGTLLKRLHGAVERETGRSLTMVGLDFNRAALEATGRTLGDIPHVLLEADIGEPGRMAEDFAALTGGDADRLLHVRSFLDHDRIYRAPGAPERAAERERLGFRASGVAGGGALVTPGALQQNLVEHLAGWAAILDRNGLLCLEVHAMSPWTKQAYFELSEGFYFDAIQALSRQYLCEPEVFLAAMAEVGLFPDRFFKAYPKGMPYARMTMGYYEKRPWTVCFADGDAVAALAGTAWAKRQSFARETAMALVEAAPASCFVLADGEGKPRAGLFADPAPFDAETESRSVAVVAAAAEDAAAGSALLGHIARYHALQDGRVTLGGALDPSLWPVPVGLDPDRVELAFGVS